MAPTGAVVNRFGACEWRACARIFAIGVQPSFFAVD
jgi:hypothetical protein